LNGVVEQAENEYYKNVIRSDVYASEDAAKKSPSQVVEIPPTVEIPPKDSVPKPKSKNIPTGMPIKSESLRLSKELSEWVNLRLPNQPVLSVPMAQNPADQAALYQFKVQFYRKAIDQFNSETSTYYSKHFADRVTKKYLELKDRGVFSDDLNNDCRNPMFLEVMAMCAKQLSDAAEKLP